MSTSTNTGLIRKIALALGAIAISTMTLAGAADAKPKFNIQLSFGGGGYYGGYAGHGGHGSFSIYSWGGPSCSYYWKKYKKTGKWFWKNKYYQCKSGH
ncbi:hypothetical protein BMS3Bbin10_01720 [bacterium BMS3Bbin10]|nr:hypothetical protein BMS3Bbin10_01720 [bacterium BMS3Bbin10]